MVDYRKKVDVKVWIVAPYDFQHDLFMSDGVKKFKPYRQAVMSSFKSAIDT